MSFLPSHPARSVVLFLLLLIPIVVSAQGRSTVTGFVYSPDKRPVEKARVELLDGLNAIGRRAETDGSGRFVFNNVGTGRFEVRVNVPGSDFEEQTQSIEISGGATRGFETVQVEFRLRSRRAKPANAATQVIFAQEVPEDAKRQFQAAVAELGRDQSSAAISSLEKAVALFPKYFAALEILGVEYMKARMYDKARSTFTTAVTVNPRSFNGWYGLSYAELATERYDGALKAANKASEIDKNAAEVYFVVGMSQRKLKDYDASEKAFLRAKDLDKGRTPEINWNLALLYGHNLKQFGKAADELDLFLKATPDNPEAAMIKRLIADFRAKHASSK